ncbi:MAG: hypothetical protein QE263_01730 [Vampirovibrionales bacterium]|nr:hypothetical protein [Vampirovibrionales bacterium]
MVSVGLSSSYSLPLQKGSLLPSIVGQTKFQGLRERQPSKAFTPLFTPQGLRQRQPCDFVSASLPKTGFGLNAPAHSSPNRFEALPIDWPADWNGSSIQVEGSTIKEADIRRLFENAAKQAALSVKQLPEKDAEDAFGASAIVVHRSQQHGSQQSDLSRYNNKVHRKDAGYYAYCAEVQTMLNAASPNGEKGFIPLLAVVNNNAPYKLGVRYAPCGPCLNEIQAAVWGNHPKARMSEDSLLAFVDTSKGKKGIIVRKVKDVLPLVPITSYSKTPIWNLQFNISDSAKTALPFQRFPRLFKLAVRLGVTVARWRAQQAEKKGVLNSKGPSIGAAILKTKWYGYRFLSGSNAYTNGRSYAPPFQNIIEDLPTTHRTQLLGGILVSNQPNINVLNIADADLLAYTAKKKNKLLIITVNNNIINVKTFTDYIPYSYHLAHHTKK